MQGNLRSKFKFYFVGLFTTTYRQSDQIQITWWRNKRAAISKIDADMVKKLKTDTETRAYVQL